MLRKSTKDFSKKSLQPVGRPRPSVRKLQMSDIKPFVPDSEENQRSNLISALDDVNWHPESELTMEIRGLLRQKMKEINEAH